MTDQLACRDRHLPVDAIDQPSFGARKIRRQLGERRPGFEEIRQMIERVAPRIAFVANPALQHAEGRGAISPLAKLKAAGEFGYVLEAGPFAQEAADFHFRVGALLETAKDF